MYKATVELRIVSHAKPAYWRSRTYTGPTKTGVRKLARRLVAEHSHEGKYRVEEVR